MKKHEAEALLAKNKGGCIYPKHAPHIVLTKAHLGDEWGYDNIINDTVNDGYHKVTYERYNCMDMPPIMMSLIRSL